MRTRGHKELLPLAIFLGCPQRRDIATQDLENPQIIDEYSRLYNFYHTQNQKQQLYAFCLVAHSRRSQKNCSSVPLIFVFPRRFAKVNSAIPKSHIISHLSMRIHPFSGDGAARKNIPSGLFGAKLCRQSFLTLVFGTRCGLWKNGRKFDFDQAWSRVVWLRRFEPKFTLWKSIIAIRRTGR